MHAGRAGPGRRRGEGLEQPAAVAGPLELRQQVDVQVGRVVEQARPEQALRPVVQGEHLILGGDRGLRRDRVAAGQPRDPPLAIGASERGRVRGPEHIAGRLAPVVQDEGELRFHEDVGTGEQVRHQVIAAVLAPGVPAAVRGPHADGVDRGQVPFVIAADDRGHVVSLPGVLGVLGVVRARASGRHDSMMPSPHPAPGPVVQRQPPARQPRSDP
jgi:hypothetical protein